MTLDIFIQKYFQTYTVKYKIYYNFSNTRTYPEPMSSSTEETESLNPKNDEPHSTDLKCNPVEKVIPIRNDGSLDYDGNISKISEFK